MDCDIDVQGEKKIVDPTTQKLVNLFESAAAKTLAFVEEDEFVEAYKNVFKTSFKPKDESQQPPLAGSSREAYKVRDSFRDSVTAKVKEEINFVVEEENLQEKFQVLEKMKVEFQHCRSKKAWRPPGDANQHMKPFDLAAKVQERDALVRLVQAEREKLNILKARVESKRKRVHLLDQTIKENQTELENEIRMTT